MSSWSSSVGRAVVLVGLLAGVAGCGGESVSEPAAAPSEPLASESTAPATPGVITLEADLYSGRENPSWTLTDEESYGFASLLAQLPVGECPSPPRDGLGLRGFGVTGLEVGRVEVDSECVRVADASGTESRRVDSQSLAHRYLADLAGHRDPSLRPLLAQR